MKFKANTRRKPIEYENALVKEWQEHKTFEKSIEMRPAKDAYVFYDGPPFITGVPHHGTLLSSVVKDAVPRYWTMKGKRVERVWGWDCHGLPAENFVERKLGIKDKRDVGTKISLEEYIITCREAMVQTGSEWEDTIARIGRWVDFKGAYKTMDKPYMESVWWAFKKLHEAGKIYEGEKVLMYCTRCATPIAKAEVAMDNSYQDVTDPSVYIKFKLKDWNSTEKSGLDAELGSDGGADRDVEDATSKGALHVTNDALRQKHQQAAGSASGQADAGQTFLLAWTTTPWTLPANTAAAVNGDVEYAEVEVDGQNFILAKELLDKVLTNEKHEVLSYTIKRTFKGKELVGKTYEPLFEDRGKGAHTVYHANYVSTEDGTGIVHLAPAYGEEDYELAKAKGFPAVSNVDENGLYNAGEWQGQLVWDVNKEIAKTLHERGAVWKIDYIRHSYPHCHRCATKLMYRAHPSWFMNIDSQRAEMLDENQNINWFPNHFKNGRFKNNVASAPDWNLSRDRFWATPIPVWKGVDKDGKEHIKVIGSYAELKELSGVELEDYHRPWIDEIVFKIDGIEYKRIDKVMDSWFEAGSMPFAQFHYPFENTQKFEANFPGDFIAEYVGQVRAWFYYLHAVSVGLFGKNSFKNVIVTGTIAGSDGRKMSKNYGNYTDPNELMDTYSADALRFLLLSSPLLNGEDFLLADKDVGDVQRKLNMIWNMYDFFTMYAEVDGWEWDDNLADPTPALTNPLDLWVVSRVHELTAEVDKHMQGYDIPNAMKPLLEFVDDASNWYVRRSRKRFWKSQNDGDKQAAYRTLHYILVQTAMVFAPFTPFLAEELYQKLTGDESVHLLDWPNGGEVDEVLITHMKQARSFVTEGLNQRAQAGIKVRQPLQSVKLITNSTFHPDLFEIIKDELNVKEVVEHGSKDGETTGIEIDTNITPDLQREGLARDVIRQAQEHRKKSGLEVDDRIELQLETESKELTSAIKEHAGTIQEETLAKKLETKATFTDAVTLKIGDYELTIALKKV